MAIDAAPRSATAPPVPHVRSHRPTIATTTLGLVVATLVGCALAYGLATRAHTLATASSVRTVDSLVEIAVCGTGALVAGWLAASALLALGCLAARLVGSSWHLGERVVHRCAPTVVRRSLVLVVGASIGLGAATGASAAVAPTPPPTATAAASSVTADDFGWAVTTPADAAAPGPTPATAAPPVDVPTAASGSAPTATSAVPTPATPVSTPATPELAPATPLPAPATPLPAPVSTPVAPAPQAAAPAAAQTPAPAAGTNREARTGDVVVVAGDSLWAIAARHLAPDASDAEIAASWPQWYHANATVIGPDPGLIVAGQELTAPITLDGASS
ncbi:LysM peptidoglycan-binding domain-containing protein [Cellulomonas sp. URHD0024]|uniref:LysM peptidoglycan-binding domain-containing protein n=1 Tax=Cellulomonas sp. URHD0024 TaxID=1302620 RepID=UPI000417CBCE|nr:LysM domain-containing protein [Cellulomonas sp. URHD0024]